MGNTITRTHNGFSDIATQQLRRNPTPQSGSSYMGGVLPTGDQFNVDDLLRFMNYVIADTTAVESNITSGAVAITTADNTDAVGSMYETTQATEAGASRGHRSRAEEAKSWQGPPAEGENRSRAAESRGRGHGVDDDDDNDEDDSKPGRAHGHHKKSHGKKHHGTEGPGASGAGTSLQDFLANGTSNIQLTPDIVADLQFISQGLNTPDADPAVMAQALQTLLRHLVTAASTQSQPVGSEAAPAS